MVSKTFRIEPPLIEKKATKIETQSERRVAEKSDEGNDISDTWPDGEMADCPLPAHVTNRLLL